MTTISAWAMERALSELAEFAADGFFEVQEDAAARNERHVLRLATAIDSARHQRRSEGFDDAVKMLRERSSDIANLDMSAASYRKAADYLDTKKPPAGDL